MLNSDCWGEPELEIDELGAVTAGVAPAPFPVESEQALDQLEETVPASRSTARYSCWASMTQALCPFTSVTCSAPEPKSWTRFWPCPWTITIAPSSACPGTDPTSRAETAPVSQQLCGSNRALLTGRSEQDIGAALLELATWWAWVATGADPRPEALRGPPGPTVAVRKLLAPTRTSAAMIAGPIRR